MLHISLTQKLDRPTEIITFSLSFTAQMLLGADDPVLVAEAWPSLKFVEMKNGRHMFTATREDARTLCYDLNERSEGGEFGFGHSPFERVCARRHAKLLFAQLFPQSN